MQEIWVQVSTVLSLSLWSVFSYLGVRNISSFSEEENTERAEGIGPQNLFLENCLHSHWPGPEVVHI